MEISTKRVFLLALVISALWVSSCGDKNEEEKQDNFVPQASGKAETVVVIMDSTLKKSVLGKNIDSILSFSFPGLLFEEEVLSPQYIQPSSFGKIWERFRHIFIPLVLSDASEQNSRIRSYFTDQLLKHKKEDFYAFIQKDVFAKGQDVYVVVAKDQQTLTDSILTLLPSIRYFYDQQILSYLKKNLTRNAQTALETEVENNFNLSLTIPQDFQLAMKDSNFFWFRKPHQDYDLNFWCTYKTYTTEEQFDDENILTWRNQIGKQKLLGTNSHMETQTDPPPVFTEHTINNQYVKVGRGLWQMSADNFMGGYLVSYTFVNEKRNKIYYLESFLYYPRQNSSKKYWADKMRKYREGEAIINSFELK